MIGISDNRDLPKLANDWYEDLEHFLKDELKGKNRPYVTVGKKRKYFVSRLNKYKFQMASLRKARNLDNTQRQELWRYVRTFIVDLENIVKADKNKTEQLVKMQDRCTDRKVRDIIREVFKQIYEDFTHHTATGAKSEIGYLYMERLNVRTCPYCNRQYTFTIRRKKGGNGKFCTRPEFDHFYEKSKYPLLALTFFNLIPSCHDCNHGKLTKRVGVNPYFDRFDCKFRIHGREQEPLSKNEILHIRDVNDFTLNFDHPSDLEQLNIDSFGLLEQYAEHRDYVMAIIEKSVTYDSVMEQGIPDAFQGTFRSPADVRRLIWGKYLDDAHYGNRPLSKLTKDILEQLEIDE